MNNPEFFYSLFLTLIFTAGFILLCWWCVTGGKEIESEDAQDTEPQISMMVFVYGFFGCLLTASIWAWWLH